MDDVDFWNAFGGLQGFEVLRKYIKQSNDTCRTLAGILQERVELETSYSKSLSKISAKLSKTAAQCLGTMEVAWKAVSTSMDDEAEYHRQLASSVEEFVLQPMRNLADNFNKSRKPVEAAVDRTSKSLLALRGEESRLKKVAHTQAKDAEKAYDSANNAKRGAVHDKEVAKMDRKWRTADEAARKSEKDFYDLALKSEAARLDWEAAVYKACAQLQLLEEDRLKQSHEMLKKYNYNVASISTSHRNLSDRLAASMDGVDVRADLHKVIELRGCGPTQPEQLLVDFYAEDMTVAMDRERRKHLLESYYAFAWQDMEREQKSKQGIEKLLAVYKTNPKFSDNENQEEIRHKLISADSLLNYLDVCMYKLSCTLAVTKSAPKPQHRLAPYLEFTKDRHGLQQSVLRVPVSQLAFPSVDGHVSVAQRRQPISDDFDDDFDPEFDEPPTQARIATVTAAPPARPVAPVASRGSVRRQTTVDEGAGDSVAGVRNSNTRPVIGWCRSKYDFEARDGEELGMKSGDVISIYKKVDETWWEGELNGHIGLFPSNYVVEF